MNWFSSFLMKDSVIRLRSKTHICMNKLVSFVSHLNVFDFMISSLAWLWHNLNVEDPEDLLAPTPVYMMALVDINLRPISEQAILFILVIRIAEVNAQTAKVSSLPLPMMKMVSQTDDRE